MPIGEVAFAAGFGTLRQFNMSIREACGCPPRDIRNGRKPRSAAGPGAIQLRLPYHPPHDTAALVRFLAARAIAGVEQAEDGRFVRSLRLPHGTGVMRIEPAAGAVQAHFALEDMSDLAAAVAACQDLLDLRSDPRPIVEHLGADPLIGGLVKGSPGRRVPGTVDAGELAMRAVLGQQVTLKAAAKLGAHLAAAYGEPISQPGVVTRVFPTVERIANADLSRLPMPRARQRALQALAQSLITVPLHARSDDVAGTLRTLPGIGPWTAATSRCAPFGIPTPSSPTTSACGGGQRCSGSGGRPGSSSASPSGGDHTGPMPFSTCGRSSREKRRIERWQPELLYTTLTTPVGELLLCGDRSEIVGIHFACSPYRPEVGAGQRAEPGVFAAAREQLDEYFDGRRTRFDLPLRWPAGTPFLREVWAAVGRVPYGSTSTYAAIATGLNRPHSARAVGVANARNPFAIVVPCHRLLGSASALRGYAGGLGAKRFLLDHEARFSRAGSIA